MQKIEVDDVPAQSAPTRKRMRLREYDYSQAGCYFVTVCVKDRRERLGRIDVGANCVRPVLSRMGQIVEEEISILSGTYNGVIVDKYTVMPNHIHLIIQIAPPSGRTQFAPTIPRIIKQFKGSITKKIGESIWQKSYHDHIVRDEEEYQTIWQYIDENPARWQEDRYFTETVQNPENKERI